MSEYLTRYTLAKLKKASSAATGGGGGGGGGDAVVDANFYTVPPGKVAVDTDNYVIAATPSGKKVYLNVLTFNGPPNGDINGQYFGQLLVEFSADETSIVNLWVYANRTPNQNTGWMPLAIGA